MGETGCFRISAILQIVLTGLIVTTMVYPVSAAEVSIGTIIDTVGMVHDSTTLYQADGIGNISGSSSLYRDSTMTNGGSLSVSKSVASSPSISGQGVDAQKILRYQAEKTGSHLAQSEQMITTSSVTAQEASSPLCVMGSDGSSGMNQSLSTTAALDIVSATALELTTRARISPGDLEYSVSANTSASSVSSPAPATLRTSFTYESGTDNSQMKTHDNTMVSGLFDLFTRVYHGSDHAEIKAQTRGTGMVSSRTDTEYTRERVSVNESDDWAGSAVYVADILTNGGDIEESRLVTADTRTSSERILTYHANGSNTMQSMERLIAGKDAPISDDTRYDPTCVFMPDGHYNESGGSYQMVSASSQILGVDSAQSVSRGILDIGAAENGSAQVTVNYQASITSPVQFDPGLVYTMADLDNDGTFEDLNGNGKPDLQDLVLLFKNFEWLSNSNLSPRFDYNQNGRVDFADLTLAFHNAGTR